MGLLGNSSNPVVTHTWQKKQSLKESNHSLFWAVINGLMAFAVYLDLTFFKVIISQVETSATVLWHAECGLMILFLVNTVVDVFRYAKPYLFGSMVEVTVQQKDLLGINNTDIGFKLSPPRANNQSAPSGLIFSTASPGAPPTFSSTPSTGSPRHQTPTNLSLSSPYSYGSPVGTYTSFSASPSPSSSYDRLPSLNLSGMNSSAPMSQNASFSSDHYSSFDTSGVRSRQSFNSSIRSTPSKSFDRITDLKSLNQYLKEQEELEYRSSLSSPEMSSTSGSSFWSYGKTAMDYTQQVLRKYQYQLATRSPQSHSARSTDNDQSLTFGAEEVWSKLGVSEDELYLWTERLRKWWCQTVVARLARQIGEVNATLRRIGCEDTEIGEVGVSTLKQLALTKGPLVPQLNSIVPYLDFSSNQEYVVKRILDLGKDGCMSDFSWNKGGNYGKTWGEHLPTDAGLVMHMLCAYLDSRLPAQPRFPDGKTFTSQYFLKTPDKPNLTKKDNLCIYQSTINPPHFQVIIGDDIWNLPKGRNNMFQAVMLFMYHIRTKEHGMLGRVNLGMSGINVLWIFN